jgi:DNA-binding LytR/AlgR family response regulator
LHIRGAVAAAFLLALASHPARAVKLVPAPPKSTPSVQLEAPESGSRTPPAEESTTTRPRRATRRPGEFLRWIIASHGDDLELVDIGEVCFFQSDNKYTRVATADRDLFIRKTIKELAATLDPEAFWQVRRSTIVNLAMVASICHGVDGKLVVRLRDRRELLQVSQAYAYRFHRM